jgi:glycosyltransferase involved in cell wall biosynthesis
MKIAVYVHVSRLRKPTGVGSHMIRMTQELAAMQGMDVSILAPRNELNSIGRIPDEIPLGHVPVLALPLPRRWMEGMWWTLNWPRVDRLFPGLDWVYCPVEAYVATGKTPLAVTVHDTYPFEPDLPGSDTAGRANERKHWHHMFKGIRKNAKLILAVSQFTKSRLIDLFGLDPNRIAVIGNGVEDIYFAEPTPGESDSVPALPPSPYLLVVGGLNLKKGWPYLMELAKRLAEIRPEMRIFVTGHPEPIYDEQAKAFSNIVHLGYVPLPRQVRLLRGALALLVLSAYEGFGIPPLEAMAVGTPAIVSGLAALPETVGDAGVIVDVHNVDSIIDAINRVEQDNEFRTQLIARGKPRAAQFRWPQCAKRLHAALLSASQ